jgi:hypothetical protein
MIGWSLFLFCVLLIYLTRPKPKVKGKQASSKSIGVKVESRQSKAKITIEQPGQSSRVNDQLPALKHALIENTAPPIVYPAVAITPIEARPPVSDVNVDVPVERRDAANQVVINSLVDRLMNIGAMAPDPNDKPRLVVKGFLNKQVDEEPAKYVEDKVASLIEPVTKMPPWGHSYIYSREELRSAKPDQKKFYAYYKSCFFEGELIEVGDNTNYGFILYFDLIHDYGAHLDLNLLERQFGELEKSCPKTQYYGRNFLIEKMRASGDEAGLQRLGYVEHWSTRYEKQLDLSKAEKIWYDSVYISSNNFINIDQCGLETFRLYIRSVRIFKAQCQSSGTTMEESFRFILDLIARKERRYHLDSPNYKYTMEQFSLVYGIMLRYCENQLREIYGHKRKINLLNDYNHKEVIDTINGQLIRRLESGKLELIKDVPAPVEATIIALNMVNITRWKDHIELTEAHFVSAGKTVFLQQAEQVIVENRNNPSLEMIFLELSKFLAPLDKISCLQYHLRYVMQNALAKKLVLKPMPKLVQKSVFENDKQYQRFEIIIKKLTGSLDLDTAVADAVAIYTPARKKILLDTETIRQVVAEHSQSVAVLNEYLKEEEVVLQDTPRLTTSTGSIEKEKIDTSIYKQEATGSLSQTGLKLLELFRFNNLRLSAIDIDNFCRDNGVMKGALIDSVNEHLYELIDDVLIEEKEDEGYAVSPDYFQMLVYASN